MKIMILILTLVLSGTVYSQDSILVKKYAMELEMGEALQMEGKALKFIEVISDSRCPKGVTYIWEGEVKMLFKIYEEGELMGDKVLIASGGAENSSLVDLFPKANLFISYLKLDPYPSINEKIPPSDYRVNVEVQKLKGK